LVFCRCAASADIALDNSHIHALSKMDDFAPYFAVEAQEGAAFYLQRRLFYPVAEEYPGLTFMLTRGPLQPISS